MNNLHLTTKPRLSLNPDGTPRINEYTGKQDVNVPAKMVSIDPEPVDYVNASGESKQFLRATATIKMPNGKLQNVSVAVGESAFEKVEKDQVYWITPRKSEDGQYTNFSCGGLMVTEVATGDVADAFAKALGLEEVAVAEPTVEVNAG